MVLRRGLLLLVAATLLTGLLGGLARLGVLLAWGPQVAGAHGALLVLGAFAAVIGVERAVALGDARGLLAPMLSALGAMGLIVAAPFAPWLLTAGALALVFLNLIIVRRQPAAFTVLMALGAAVLAFSAAAWASGASLQAVSPAWQVFFVLTIVSERLELSRLVATPRWATSALVLLCASAAVFGGASALGLDVGRLLGGVFVALGAWQLRFDLARVVLRRGGLPSFSATGVLLGAGWLVVAGVLLLLPESGTWRTDAVLHAVFIGYVLSMVFAHAPIILPAVARLDVPFTPALFLPLALLHLGLAVRVGADLGGSFALRQAGAIVSAVSLVVFAVTVVLSRVTRGRRELVRSAG